jgi:ubiquinone/menaquinone biosynthesis C-methylase UbiE
MTFDLTTLFEPAAAQAPGAIKVCCVALYDSEWLPLLLGDSYHPGKLALTHRLGELLELTPSDRVLDVAAGRGMSALHLAERFGCHVTGVDYAPELVAEANRQAESAGLADRVHFRHGDAEQLPLEDDSFDAILCECSFCIFPGKESAAAEFARVLRRGGRIGISDLTRSGPLPEELESLMAWVACVADARPVEDYEGILRGAGLAITRVERHDRALEELIQEVRGKLLNLELMVKLNRLELPVELDFETIGRLGRLTAEAARQGTLGYALLVGVKR